MATIFQSEQLNKDPTNPNPTNPNPTNSQPFAKQDHHFAVNYNH
jgi:hypothetical protein